jgi:hypothetical protein
MSSENKRGTWEYTLLIGSMLLMTLWYAWPQIIYSLFIGYDIGSLLAPDLMDRILSFIGGIP